MFLYICTIVSIYSAQYLLELGRIEEAVALSTSMIKAVEDELGYAARAGAGAGAGEGADGERVRSLEYALAKHLRVALIVFQELGDSAKAVEFADKIKGVDFFASVVAIDSYQAIANFPAAIAMADDMIDISTQKELRGLFKYRREIAYVNYCALDLPFSAFSMDTLVDTRVKVARTKVFGIEDEFLPVHTYTDRWQSCARKRAAHEALYSPPSADSSAAPTDAALRETGALAALAGVNTPRFRDTAHTLHAVTARLRNTFQLDSVGFYVHQRKDRMMGFSSLAMNQMLRQHARCIADGYSGLYVSSAGSSRGDMVLPQDVGGALMAALPFPSVCGHAEQLQEVPASSNAFLHRLHWRDVLDIGVRWRQLAEPSDPVWWTDRMAELMQPGADVVSTPLLTGAKKVGRYYPYFNDSFALFKKTMRHCYGVSKGSAECIRLSEIQKRTVDGATDLGQLYAVSGAKGEEIYIIANCTSTVSADRAYPCTKLALAPSNSKGEGWEFRVSAIYSTSVYELYYADMDISFQRYLNKLVEIRSTENIEVRNQLTERIVDDVLDFLYSWIHCSPLTRGSASLASTSGVAMLLAAGVCLDGKFPANKQLDWEILMSTSPRDFKARVRPWFDSMKRHPLAAGCPELTPEWLEGEHADFSMAEIFPTPRHIFGALSMKFDY
jgi:hypothetical protein